MVEDLHHYARLPIIVHVVAVLPTIPLGGWLLLARIPDRLMNTMLLG